MYMIVEYICLCNINNIILWLIIIIIIDIQ